MSIFSAAEIEYLQSQRLGRLATSGPDGQPHAVPVAFRYNPEQDTIDIGGHGFAQRKKYRDVQHNPRVAFVVDDLASVEPWRLDPASTHAGEGAGWGGFVRLLPGGRLAERSPGGLDNAGGAPGRRGL